MWADPSTVQVLAWTSSNAVVANIPLQVKGCHVQKTLGTGLRGCLLLCRYQLVLVVKGWDLLLTIWRATNASSCPTLHWHLNCKITGQFERRCVSIKQTQSDMQGVLLPSALCC